MSIYYDVTSGEFEFESGVDLNNCDGIPEGLEYVAVSPGSWRAWVDFHGEGFDLEALAPFLSLARGAHTMQVHMSDHKGARSYEVKFGDGIVEDEDGPLVGYGPKDPTAQDVELSQRDIQILHNMLYTTAVALQDVAGNVMDNERAGASKAEIEALLERFAQLI